MTKLPPHSLAILCGCLHSQCHLCHQAITHRPKSKRGVFYDVPLLCGFCQDKTPTGLPMFKIEHDHPMPLSVASFYDTPLNKVMSAYKDHQDLSALMVLYWLLSTLPAPKRLTATNAVIMPVPTTNSRLIKRGFNPVLTLAKYLSYHWQLPICQGIARHENATHQRGLGRAERLHNVQQDFYVTNLPQVKYVILFDDVVTTGATLSAMAQTLLAQNPKFVIVAVGVLHGQADLHLPVWGG